MVLQRFMRKDVLFKVQGSVLHADGVVRSSVCPSDEPEDLHTRSQSDYSIHVSQPGVETCLVSSECPNLEP